MAIIRKNESASDNERWARLNEREWNGYRRSGLFGDTQQEELTGCCCPVADIYEDETSVRLAIELPGLSESDVKVELENNILSIVGERKAPDEDELQRFNRLERCYGELSRTFTVGPTIDQSAIDATMEKGVLIVTLPKREESKAKQIEVKVQ